MAIRMADVRAAIADALRAVLLAETQIATAPDQLNPPCLLIGMPTVRYHQAMARGLDAMEIPIFGILPRIHDQAAVDQADEWISGTGSRSVLTILEADPTLGGACQTLVVREAVAELWEYPSGGAQLPSYHWLVEVYG